MRKFISAVCDHLGRIIDPDVAGRFVREIWRGASSANPDIENRHSRLHVCFEKKALTRCQIIQRRIVRNYFRIAVDLRLAAFVSACEVVAINLFRISHSIFWPMTDD